MIFIHIGRIVGHVDPQLGVFAFVRQGPGVKILISLVLYGSRWRHTGCNEQLLMAQTIPRGIFRRTQHRS